MSTINEHLGKNVKQMREYRNLSQQELADKSKISKMTIGEIERGNATPSIDTLHKISSALDCYLDITFTPVER